MAALMEAQVQAVPLSSASSSLAVGLRLRLKLSRKLVPVHCPPVKTGGTLLRSHQAARRLMKVFMSVHRGPEVRVGKVAQGCCGSGDRLRFFVAIGFERSFGLVRVPL